MALLSASRRGRALMSAMLALVIAIAAVPVVYVATDGGGRCSITLDICHPAQSVSSTPAPQMAPPPLGLHHFRASSPAHQWIAALETARETRPADAPDPPPPKPFV